MRRREDNDFNHISVAAGFGTPCHQPVTWRGVPYGRDSGGYSRIRRTRAGRPVFVLAHRVRHEAANGPIRDGMVLDHLCRNRWCCNPDHIEAVTPAENLRRGVVARLTPAQVSEMRALAGSKTQRYLAERFGVHQSSVSRIVRGEQWADGPCPAWESVKARRASGSRRALRGTCHL